MDKWLIWCGLNDEQDALEKAFGSDCVSVRGGTPSHKRIELERLWREGDVPIMITKPQVFGFGMNWQHCSNMAFVGLSDSFEQVFQAVRRCYRFGQTQPVNVTMITSSREGATAENIKRKEADFRKMVSEMVQYTKEITSENIKSTERQVTEYEAGKRMTVPSWLRSETFERTG
jgi:superfamily II DNA helicase RecQ